MIPLYYIFRMSWNQVMLSHAYNLHRLHANWKESKKNNDILSVACGVYSMCGIDRISYDHAVI